MTNQLMTWLTLALLFAVPCQLHGRGDTFGGIKLLQGYSAKRGSSVDAAAWTIEKEGGPIIQFESGPSEGSWADPKDEKIYAWYREQVVNGNKGKTCFS